jgi:hypothetical protein
LLISSTVWQVLIDAGIELRPTSAETANLVLRTPDGDTLRVEVKVRTSSRPWSPGAVREAAARADGPTLLVVPTATPAVHEAVRQAGWSLIATNASSGRGPSGTVAFGPGVQMALGDDLPVAAPHLRRGRRPWGRAALVRRLLQHPTATQGQLAAWARVTQPRASQVLSDLIRQGLVERRREGANVAFTVLDWDALLRHWLDMYPGPGGLSTYWYGLKDLPEQAARAAARLADAASADLVTSVQPFVVLSGDLAADRLAPWRRPDRVVLYARAGADLTDADLTPADEAEASVEVVVPRDPAVWPDGEEATVTTDGVPLADPLQILWDVRRGRGADVDQAALRLTDALRRRFTAGAA